MRRDDRYRTQWDVVAIWALAFCWCLVVWGLLILALAT